MFSETSYRSKPKPAAIQLYHRHRSGHHPTKPFFQEVDVERPSRIQLLRGVSQKKSNNIFATVSLVKCALWIILSGENFAQWPHLKKFFEIKKTTNISKMFENNKKIYRSNWSIRKRISKHVKPFDKDLCSYIWSIW